MMPIPTPKTDANAEDFVKWLGGYLDGLRACADLGARPPAHLDQIYAKLNELREVKKPATQSISIHRSDYLPPGAMMVGGSMARTLELRPSDLGVGSFATGGFVNAVARGTLGEHTLAAIRDDKR